MRKKRLLSKKILHILAVAALSVSLLGGQMQAVLAENPVHTVKIEESRLIFDELYVKSGVSLAEAALPEFEEGILKWEDETYIPEESVVECTVIFQPKEDQDLSKYKYLDGWDSEKKIVKTKITVIVEGFEDAGIDASEEVILEDEIPEDSVGEEVPVQEEETTEIPEETWEEEILEEETSENEISEEEIPESSNTGEEITSPEGEVLETPGEIQEEVIAGDEISEDEILEDEIPESSNGGEETSSSEEVEETPEETWEEIITEDKTSEDETTENEISEGAISEGETTEDETQDDSNVEEDAQVPEGETPGSIEEVGNVDGSKQDTEVDSGNAGEAEEPDAAEPDTTLPDISADIFNRDLVQAENDDRLVTIDEEISEEEKQRIAEENHSSNGITVTGNNLPWYVQFRAYEMEESQFSINADTNVFRGFEFELWDLRTNTEYEIPEGEYVSVIIPVLEGYTYTVEHILDNGAVETIIPTVNGSTLIFSTHSFSPFGIAGSTTIVGGDIMDDGYQSPTATPTPSLTPNVTTEPVTTPSPAATTTPAATTNPIPPTDVQEPTVTEKPGNAGGQTIFVDDEIDMSGTKNESVDMSVSNKPQQNGVVNGSQTKLPVQTGDTIMILPFVIIAVSAFSIILCVVVLKKRRK